MAFVRTKYVINHWRI